MVSQRGCDKQSNGLHDALYDAKKWSRVLVMFIKILYLHAI